MKTRHAHPTHRGVILGFSLLLLMASGGTIWWTWRAATSTPTSQSSVLSRVEKAPVLPAPPVNPQRKELQPKLYWLKVDGQQIRLLPKQVALNAAVSPEQALMEGMIHLLSQPTANDLVSAIPVGTRLLSLRVTSQGIYINLSREFSQGGGSSSMVHRVAQILYTATSLDPTAKVYLSVEGQLLDEQHPLGGEGLMLRQPLTRQQFTEDFSLS
jgi:spore germination protein GerM